jgi:hypothetical protein
MICNKPGCKGHPHVTLERNATYTMSCKACGRKVQGHATEAAAIKAFLSRYLEHGITPAEGDIRRRRLMEVDRPEPAA